MTIHVGRNALIVVGVVAVLAVAAVAEGWIPLSQLLWLGLVLACPLMMLLMMGGMHGGHGHSSERPVMDAAKQRAVDPVCGMEVDPATAAGRTEFEGEPYYFCSRGCQQTFDANSKEFAKKV